MLLNANPPQSRGTAFSVFSLADDLGKGLGPFFASGLIVLFGRKQACSFVELWPIETYYTLVSVWHRLV